MNNSVQDLATSSGKVATNPFKGSHCDFQTAEQLRRAIDRFLAWLERNGYESYDPYDIAGTRYGKFARRLYYEKRGPGVILTAPLILMEVLVPQLRRFFVKKGRYSTADAQLTLAFLNLHEVNPGEDASSDHDSAACAWLSKARNLATDLLKQSVPGYSGFCWGYPFDWQNVNGLMPKSTPHITATPYCYEAFTRLYDATGDEHYLAVARSISNFVFYDLNDTPVGNDAAASSYTPHDHGMVVNASAYRAFVLFDAACRFQDEKFFEKATKNLEFILRTQRQDGSWLYAVDNPAEAFIDHFHTCFVLKNLYKINRDLQRGEVHEAIQRGYAYYRKTLFDEAGNPKLFALAPRTEMVQLEMYNYAEDITLGSLLSKEIPGALGLAKDSATRLMERYQLSDGHFVTRIYRGGKRHTVPFLRWPQAQLFLSLTNLLLALTPDKVEN